jgi:hypothetical protein
LGVGGAVSVCGVARTLHQRTRSHISVQSLGDIVPLESNLRKMKFNFIALADELLPQLSIIDDDRVCRALIREALGGEPVEVFVIGNV